MIRYALIHLPRARRAHVRPRQLHASSSSRLATPRRHRHHGKDHAGWTLNDYVLPRWPPACTLARKSTSATQLMKEVPA